MFHNVPYLVIVLIILKINKKIYFYNTLNQLIKSSSTLKTIRIMLITYVMGI